MAKPYKYNEFQQIFSPERMRKFCVACNNDTRKAMTLYRYNLRLSQEMFVVVSCFEVTLRNRIDNLMKVRWGNDWLRDFILPGGVFYSDRRVEKTRRIIEKVYDGLMRSGLYSHSKLLSEMEFGVWKYMFSNVQYQLGGQVLLRVFPNKPTSSRYQQYDNSYIFGELDYINNLRNRIAHHEPICFNNNIQKDTAYVRNRYQRMMILFDWMGLDGKSILYGLDHSEKVCRLIDNL